MFRKITPPIFSGLDRDGAFSVLFPEVCSAINAKVVISKCLFVRQTCFAMAQLADIGGTPVGHPPRPV